MPDWWRIATESCHFASWHLCIQIKVVFQAVEPGVECIICFASDPLCVQALCYHRKHYH